MSVSSTTPASPTPGLQRNALYNLAAISTALLGFFLTLGAYGHFGAVWGEILDADTAARRRIFLMLPGVMLTATAVLNILLSKPLWQARSYALNVGLAGNLLTTSYLVYLLVRGVPDHPIGAFLALEISYVVLLAGIRAGLVWPVVMKTPTDVNSS
ncbi:hypothetical protein [Microbulbifer celer]|uniref:DUF1761 domain-containing protein n=1 Tax=Microbulbifer celer TaxID=435905 RepID=A0ABW3U9W3_9GAMM|nr:hypothetical protein [Microbulbifer celer]UFN58905.1 hypothetical protein LPW13_07660 [Microbulbifer celer]